MKVFFTASQRGKKEFGKYYKIIYNEIKKLGCAVVDDDLLNISADEYYRNLDKGGTKANIEMYKKKMSHLRESDIIILDCSFHSLSIGYMIEKSLRLNKPTIVLYYKDNESFLLEGLDDKKLIVKSYHDKNLPRVIKEIIDIARERRDKRFNFFISPRLLEYLEATSKKLGITKSTFIRNLIIEHRKKANPS